ncbi:hypothetical protein [Sphingomonas humi]|uniref:Lipoprotein n=1 Tax=Sphingomonas humi TaxID=335630 RepID=A0ABP7S7U7_9SPHN
MRYFGMAAASAAALMLGGCVREARIALPSELAASVEELGIDGMGGWRRGTFTLAGAPGEFTRGADRLQILDDLLVSNTGAGTFRYANLQGACRYREREVNVGVISARARPFSYRCLFSRNGALAGELVIEEERGTLGSMLSKRGREGFMLFDGVRYEVKSIHRDQGGGLANATPLGYRFDSAGRSFGAVDLNGTNKTLFAPRAGAAREAVFAGGLALSVLWDPAVINP